MRGTAEVVLFATLALRSTVGFAEPGDDTLQPARRSHARQCRPGIIGNTDDPTPEKESFQVF